MTDEQDPDPTLDNEGLAKKIVFQNAIAAAGWTENEDARKAIAASLPSLITEVRELRDDLRHPGVEPLWPRAWKTFIEIIVVVVLAGLAIYLPVNHRLNKLENQQPVSVPVVIVPSAGTTTTTTAAGTPSKSQISTPGSIQNKSTPPTTTAQSPNAAGATTTTTSLASTTTSTTRQVLPSITVLKCPRPPIC